MIELLSHIETAVFNILFLTTLLYALNRPKNLSLLICLIVVFLSELFLMQLDFLIFGREYKIIWYDIFVHRVIWYSVFTMMHLLAAFCIVQVHQVYREKFSIAAKSTINIYLILSITKVMFFCSSFFIEHKKLVSAYFVVTDSLFFTMLSILLYHVVKNLHFSWLPILFRKS